ncbi:MAG: tRNA (N6-isopentenyl adenosine(37)-C2)-methylthiotransferase MiaB, partial [Clostridiales bacterium]|nr:tRNA (N6-isopentenyl adenosine(37)-C2)-methylthiotransferase MiaB [Clostridiales bacterium]
MCLQKEFAGKTREYETKPNTYHIVTYGCQMNEHDSEKLAAMLEEMGLTAIQEREEADFVLFNTCCIRENAQRKALGNITWLKHLKKKKPALLVGVCGCMVQQKGMREMILKQYPFVDMAFGTHNLYQFPELFYQMLVEKKRVVEIIENEYLIAEGIPVLREKPYKGFITIMYGCNNYCSYCIVPYVRGKERSRNPQEIVKEAKNLYNQGVKEIMLLGQNVNSYQGGAQGEVTFPKLLEALDEIGIPRIRFMTSHPKDLSSDLIQVMKNSKHICNHFHLPIQSGSNTILKAMNRGYTVEEYLTKINALREAIPGIGITTDLIVAFPGETEEDFENTLSLVKQVGFDAAFTFVFSPRNGTKAATMENQLDKKTGKERIGRLIKLQDEITKKIHDSLLGQIEEVLVEGFSKKDPSRVSGKGTRSITITFDGSHEDIGEIIP